MTVATFNQNDFTLQDAATYKAALDGNIAVLAKLAASFAPHEQPTPNLTVAVDGGLKFLTGALSLVAAQSTSAITAPASNPRIDRVVIDRTSGAVSVVTGTEAVSPTAPAIPAGKLPICQVLLQTTSTSITNSMITDERVVTHLVTESSNSVQTLAKSAVPLSFVAVDTAFTGVTYSNNGGKVQFSSSGVHGLTTSPAVGASVYVAWTGGTGIDGFYKVLSIDTTNDLTIDLVYAAGLGTPTLTPAGDYVALASILVPSGTLGPSGCLDCHTFFDGTSSGNDKTTKFIIGSEYIDSNAFNSGSQPYDWFLVNRGSLTEQLYTLKDTYISGGKAVDFSIDQTIYLEAAASVPNEIITLEGYVIRAEY